MPADVRAGMINDISAGVINAIKNASFMDQIDKVYIFSVRMNKWPYKRPVHVSIDDRVVSAWSNEKKDNDKLFLNLMPEDNKDWSFSKDKTPFTSSNIRLV